MTQARFDIANKMAENLARAGTDHNEVAKASGYLSQTRDAKAFFTWLDWMATPRVSEKLARSNRTPEYYRQIRDACQQLRPIKNVDEIAQTMGWAVRLMRYIPKARPVKPEELVALLEAKPGKRPEPTGSTRPPRPPGVKPGRITDLRPGIELSGTVKRTANFGAFVDVGVGRDGLVHISKLKEGFVPDVQSVVEEGQQVTVWVENVDAAKGRIGLTMIPPKAGARPVEPAPTLQPSPQPTTTKPVAATPPPRPTAVWLSPGAKPKDGTWVKGTIKAIDTNRLVVDVGLADTATLMFEYLPGQPTDQFDVEEKYVVGQEIEAQVLRINKRGRVQLKMIKG